MSPDNLPDIIQLDSHRLHRWPDNNATFWGQVRRARRQPTLPKKKKKKQSPDLYEQTPLCSKMPLLWKPRERTWATAETRGETPPWQTAAKSTQEVSRSFGKSSQALRRNTHGTDLVPVFQMQIAKVDPGALRESPQGQGHSIWSPGSGYRALNHLYMKMKVTSLQRLLKVTWEVTCECRQ